MKRAPLIVLHFLCHACKWFTVYHIAQTECEGRTVIFKITSVREVSILMQEIHRSLDL